MTAAEAIDILRGRIETANRNAAVTCRLDRDTARAIIATLAGQERDADNLANKVIVHLRELAAANGALHNLVTAAERAFDWRKDGEMHKRIKEAKEVLG